MKSTMIKSAMALLMAFMVLPMMGQDYLKIYFRDGHTERHFMHLVKSINATKYDLEGYMHEDYQIQQIIMEDTTYSYYIADIDSMTYRKVDEEQLSSRVESVQSSLEPILQQCSSMEDLASHIDEIKSIDGVENVLSDSDNIVVQIRDWFDVCINHQPVPDKTDPSSVSLLKNKIKQILPTAEDGSPIKVTMGFQMENDETWEDGKSLYLDLCEILETMGYGLHSYMGKEMDLDFFTSRIFDSNLLVISTHGGIGPINKKHFLYTGIEAVNWSSFTDLAAQELLGAGHDIDEISITCCEHSEGGFFGSKWYWLVREDFIRKSPYRFPDSGPHIVFMAACSSLAGNDILTYRDGKPIYGNDSFAKIFFDKGADVYFGYNAGTAYASIAMCQFTDYMLHGASVEQAFNKMGPLYKYESDTEDRAYLVDLYKENAESNSKCIFLVSTQTVEKTEQEAISEYKDAGEVELKGETVISPFDRKLDYNFLNGGFFVATQPDVDNLNGSNIPSSKSQYTDSQRGEYSFSAKFTPTPDITYYYRAYTFDGLHYNYGETHHFKINGGDTPDDRMNVGDSFTIPTEEGKDVVYTITKKDESGYACKVGYNTNAASGGGQRIARSGISPAVDLESEGTITIPESAAGYTVTALGTNAFKGCKKLTDINLPESILEIGESAEENCSGLTSITIPKNVMAIKANAYGGCRNVTSIYCEISDPFAIDENVFLTEDEEAGGATSSDIFTNATLYVPEGSKEKYAATAGWSRFTHLEEYSGAPDTGTPEDVEAVDLGLPSGLKWANMNVGASSPEDYGDYFAWGEVTPKSEYNWSTYKWCNGDGVSLTKYCTDSDYGNYGNDGFVDNKTVLDAEDDAAHVNWGGDWRMPTHAECQELIDNTTSEWTTQNGVNGRKFTSKTNGKSIFLPAAGNRWNGELYNAGLDGCYWSSALNESEPDLARILRFSSGNVRTSDGCRNYGLSVRPVRQGSSLSVSANALSLQVGESATVDVSGSGSYKAVSNAESVATVTVEGSKLVITGVSPGSATITVKDNQTQERAKVEVTVSDSMQPEGVEAVDLGLPSGLKWANMNVGASSPEDYGDYFAWGEVTPQSDNAYSWESYKWCNGSSRTMTKYCTDSYYGNDGFTDNKTVLDAEDDAAHANWGGDWRMPTEAECQELIDNTTSEWTTQNGVYGRKFTSKTNGKSIFLPAAGYRWSGELGYAGSSGGYWSSTLGGSYPIFALLLGFGSGGVSASNDYRGNGQGVRPVRQN